MALEERFMYTVHPRRPIRNLIKGKVIIKPETLSLTKEEVLDCLKYGAVYRKFYMEPNSERVYPSNIDRLHRSKHLSEAAYAVLVKAEGQKTVSGLSDEGSGTVSPDPIDEEIIKPSDENMEGLEESVEESKKAEEEQLSIDETLADNSVESDVTEESVDDEDEIIEGGVDTGFVGKNDIDVLPAENSYNRNYPTSKSGKKNKKHRHNNYSATSSVPETANK